jgi:hypothetical protein
LEIISITTNGYMPPPNHGWISQMGLAHRLDNADVGANDFPKSQMFTGASGTMMDTAVTSVQPPLPAYFERMLPAPAGPLASSSWAAAVDLTTDNDDNDTVEYVDGDTADYVCRLEAMTTISLATLEKLDPHPYADAVRREIPVLIQKLLETADAFRMVINDTHHDKHGNVSTPMRATALEHFNSVQQEFDLLQRRSKPYVDGSSSSESENEPQSSQLQKRRRLSKKTSAAEAKFNPL